MNAKVVLYKSGRKKTIEITDKHVVIITGYNTTFDAERVYRDTRSYFVKRGWKRAKDATFSITENTPRRSKVSKFLGRIVKGDGTVGE